LKILLADDDTARARALIQLLSTDASVQVIRVPPSGDIAELVVAAAPDVVIVDMARPDRDALDGVRQINTRNPRPVVLFVDEDDPGFMEEAIAAGVSSYNVLGTPPPDVKPILRAAVALFRRHQRAQELLHHTEARLGERAAVDRAKALLIRERHLSEPEAYRWMQRQAMRRGRRIVEIAREILHEHGETAP
jgi:two-component system, response regulator / RNA-binding antiterminator